MTGTSKKRILIGAGCFADAQGAFSIVVHLAKIMAIDLVGLLADESQDRYTAITPRQRIVTADGHLIAAPSAVQWRRMSVADARAFRHRLERLASSMAVHWTFDQRVGDLMSVLFELAGPTDIVIVGHREIHKRKGSVVVITSEADTSAESMEVAESLATAMQTGVVMIQNAHQTTEGMIIDQISRVNAAAIVLDLDSGPLRSVDHLRDLFDAARCPVLILGASRFRANDDAADQRAARSKA